MIEKAVVDTTVKGARTAEKGMERLLKKVWSVLDAASEKQTPSQYLGDEGVKSIQGKQK